jgi:type VI protein secretion system component VasF
VSGIPIQSLSPARQRGAACRRRLQRDLLWLLALKFAALGVLWLLFFSAVHQPAVDASAASRQLAVAGSTP